MSLVLHGTDGVTFNDSSLQGAAASPFVLKNRIINGDFRIDQRNAGASVTPTDLQYVLDRWYARQTTASKFSVQQNAGSVTPPTGFTNYLGATSLSAYSVNSTDFFALEQRIEGFNIADLGWGTANAQTVTLSFWVRSSLTGTFGGCLRNSSSNYNYPFTYTISSANTWEYKTVTVFGPTSGTWLTTNGTGLLCGFNLGIGSSFTGTGNAWNSGASGPYNPTGATSVVGTNGATFYITGVQLEIGTSATPFERRLYNQELANCQRYYFRKITGNASGSAVGVGSYYSTTQLFTTFDLPVEMRSAPTLDASSGTNYYRAAVNSGTDAFDGFSLDGATSKSRAILITSTNISGTVGWAAMVYTDNASAYVGMSAEL